MAHELTTIRGIGPAAAAQLESAGFAAVADVANAELADLSAIRGFGIIRAAAIRDDAARLTAEAAAPSEAEPEALPEAPPVTETTPDKQAGDPDDVTPEPPKEASTIAKKDKAAKK
ncbi:MAG: helix-hairpin-helix domain-containing protein, partial [Acidobacteriota bacterium]